MKDPQMNPNVPINSGLKFAISYLKRRWPDAGSVEVCFWKDYVAANYGPYSCRESYARFREGMGIDFLPDDKCIWLYYDFMDDELTEDERELFYKDLELLWNALRIQGEPLAQNDGSGGGLIYGFALFKP